MRFLPSSFALFLLSVTIAANAVTPKPDWKDSYSVDGQCYCYTTYDHDIGDVLVETLQGEKTVRQICETIGPGPGVDGNPVYNDIQCGNGPPNNVGDEDPDVCPGRTDLGADGCLLTGPTWNLDTWFPDEDTVTEPTPEPEPEPEPTPEPEAPSTPATDTSNSQTDETPTLEANTEEDSASENAVPENPVNGESQSSANSTGESTSPTQTVTPTTQPPVIDPPGIVVEAERFSNRTLFWQVIASGTNFDDDDFWRDSDTNHSSSASNNAYLELLPDVRVRSDDSPSSDSNWAQPGEGHRIEYLVSIVNAGQYAVQTLSWSSGTEDDSVFVGINDVWSPESSLVQNCGAKNQWVWSGCALDQRAVIDVPTAGVHTIVFSGSEDGFEMDKFALTRIGDTSLALGAAVSTGGRDELAALGKCSLAALALLGTFLFRRLV